MNVLSADHGQSVFTYNLSNDISWPSTDTEMPMELKADFFYANAINPSQLTNGCIYTGHDKMLYSFNLQLANQTHQGVQIKGKM